MKSQKKLFVVAALAALTVSCASAKVSAGKSYGDWKGFCEKDLCGVEQIVKEDGKPIAAMALRKAPNNQITALISLPLGVFLAPGVEIAVDGQKLGAAPYAFCDPAGCNIVPIPLDNATLDKVKKGSNLQVTALFGQQKKTLKFSLKGVTSAISSL